MIFTLDPDVVQAKVDKAYSDRIDKRKDKQDLFIEADPEIATLFKNSKAMSGK